MNGNGRPTLLGVYDGMSLEQQQMASDQMSARVAANEAAKIKNIYGGLTSDEVIRRLAKFYGNRRNQPIFVSEAVSIVAIEGQANTKELKAMYQEMLDDSRTRGAKGW